MQEALKREFVSRYICEDGLGLGNGEKPRLMSDGSTAVGNDNGILFAVLGYFTFAPLLDGADAHRFMAAVKGLEVKPGLYKRRPDAGTRHEAHDNYDAIAAGSVLFRQPFARDICDYGESNGWAFNNVVPDSWRWQSLRQGGSIAFYKICAGRIPYPLEMLWLCAGYLLALARGWSSQWNLAWLKHEAIPMALEQYAITPAWSWVTTSWRVTSAIGELIASRRKLYPRSFAEYFGASHAITRGHIS